MRRIILVLAVSAIMVALAAAPTMADICMSVSGGCKDDNDKSYYVYDNDDAYYYDDDERYRYTPYGVLEYEYDDGRWLYDDFEPYDNYVYPWY